MACRSVEGVIIFATPFYCILGLVISCSGWRGGGGHMFDDVILEDFSTLSCMFLAENVSVVVRFLSYYFTTAVK